MKQKNIKQRNDILILNHQDKNNLNFEEFTNTVLELSKKYVLALTIVEKQICKIDNDFKVLNKTSPIEHISSRIKTPNSILEKMKRRNLSSFDKQTIEDNILDIAGVRISCSFMDDIYRIAEILSKQSIWQVELVKDYVKKAKKSGYRSYHLIVKVPVISHNKTKFVNVEIQIRTMAMDFWASLEHKIKYKYDGVIPNGVEDELYECAMMSLQMDEQMQKIKNEVLDANTINMNQNLVVVPNLKSYYIDNFQKSECNIQQYG